MIDDDNPAALPLAEALRNAACQVQRVSGVRQALECLRGESGESIGCILILSCAGQRIWLEELASLGRELPWMSKVLLCDECDKEMLLKAIRSDYCDVLELPADAAALQRCVENASARTAQRRSQHRVSMEARVATKIHRRMAPGGVPKLPDDFAPGFVLKADAVFVPALEAGGDIFALFALDSHRLLILGSDVSGHDISAGYVSTLFLGMCRGMLALNAGPEEICAQFGRFLMREWNANKEPEQLITSIATCFVVLDFEKMLVHSATNGFPSPCLFNAQLGEYRPGGKEPPLGWFDTPPARMRQSNLPERGSLLIYSDGLDEMRHRRKQCEFYSADTLIEQNRGRSEPMHIPGQRDDAMVVRLSWHKRGAQAAGAMRVLGCAQYNGNDGGRIDQIQMIFDRVLRNKMPQMLPQKRQDVMLCLREAMLNAFNHGCGGDSSRKCRIRMATFGDRLLRVRVCYDGEPFPGILPAPSPGHIPFGLKIISAMCSSYERIAAENALVMDFLLH